MGAGRKRFGDRRRLAWPGLAALVTAFIGVDFFANGEQLTASRCGRGCR
ncbi:hypothetical protein ACVXHA_19455 [Escherichia coli]